ncbi:hypothetical protein JMN32_12140 [Fulvivirga sp. 29W222]|uniref:Uncharacterized protein n=1 Tax=Fulvivirga marina TaxID=2494733 RepID=A0A937KEC5_9BACT|nr:hypothetical protein [Fulvivirga marina]MBL6447063.1 hypothetical protein [Fulvivirga marina]
MAGGRRKEGPDKADLPVPVYLSSQSLMTYFFSLWLCPTLGRTTGPLKYVGAIKASFRGDSLT